MKITPWAAGLMKVAVLSAAFAIPGTAMASASLIPGSTSGDGSILGGNQVNLPVSAPIDICGNAVGVLGNALGGCSGGASVNNSGGSSGSGGVERTSGNGSIGGGNQINAPVSAPVDVCGNAVGNAAAHCRGGASVGSGSNRTINPGGPNAGGGGAGGAGGAGGSTIERTSGNGSILGGNQVDAPISVPVNLCGNAVALLGQSEAACAGGSYVTDATGSRGGGGGRTTFQRTSGNGSIGGGNQVDAPISAPVDVCGNAIAVLGDALAGCRGGASVTGTTTSSTSERTSGNGVHPGW